MACFIPPLLAFGEPSKSNTFTKISRAFTRENSVMLSETKWIEFVTTSLKLLSTITAAGGRYSPVVGCFPLYAKNFKWKT